eukprot:2880281-Rhodomonas_salina.2
MPRPFACRKERSDRQGEMEWGVWEFCGFHYKCNTDSKFCLYGDVLQWPQYPGTIQTIHFKIGSTQTVSYRYSHCSWFKFAK